MRKAAIFLVALACGFISCSGEPDGIVTHRARNGRPDQWVYRINKDTYKIAIDTNGDGRPDIVKTYKNKELVEIESDRNFNGQVDLVQEYSDGVLIREIHDDNFDGKPETIKEFRQGKLAIVELDPQERGYVDIVEYYDDSGKLIRREFRQKRAVQRPNLSAPPEVGGSLAPPPQSALQQACAIPRAPCSTPPDEKQKQGQHQGGGNGKRS
jgi:hypothetical protein